MSVTTRSPLLALFLSLGTGACAPQDPPEEGKEALAQRCGPAVGVVERVIDGDTIVLESGEKVRYLLVDTPEITSGKHDCYGQEAADYNAEIVLGQEVELTYDVECSDAYGRLLAYVEAPDGEINTLLVSRGYACVLEIPPNGAERSAEFEAMEARAQDDRAGLWGSCASPCSE